MGPFEILQHIRNATYRLALTSKLSHVHNIFNMSMLKKYEPGPLHVINYNKIEVDKNAMFVEELIRIWTTKCVS